MKKLLLTLTLGLLPFTAAAANPLCGASLSGITHLDGPLVCAGSALSLQSGATLECHGFTITGPDPLPASCEDILPGCVTGHYGIRVDGKSAVTIRGCVIEGFERGLYLTDMTNSLIDGNVSRKNTRYGIQLSGASFGNTFQNNVARKNKDEGFHFSDLTGGANTSIGDRSQENTAEGFYLLQADNLSMTGCRTLANGQPGLYIKNSRNVTITDCILTQDNVQILDDEVGVVSVTKIQTAP